MAGHRIEHLQETIRQKLSTILIREAQDPRFRLVTIVGVDLSRDLSSARVSFSTFDSETNIGDLTDSLNRAAGFFGHILGKTLSTRHTPRLHFHYDPGFDNAQEMEVLLKKVREEDG